MHFRLFHTIHGLFSLDTKSTSTFSIPVVTTENVSRHCEMFPGGVPLPQLRTVDVYQADFQKVLDVYLRWEKADNILLVFFKCMVTTKREKGTSKPC